MPQDTDFLTIYEIGGILVTLSVALFTYWRASSEVRTINTLLVTVLGAVFTVLLSLRFGVFPQIQSTLSLTADLNDVPRVAGLVQPLAEVERIATSDQEPFMSAALDMMLSELEENIRLFEDGKFRIEESEIPTFALRLIREARLSYRATSFVQLDEWWETPWGQTYDSLNLVAVQRGVEITRTFIFSTSEEFEAARPYLDRQASGGIHVKVAMVDDLNTQITSDMLIIDGETTGELLLTPDKGIRYADFCVGESDVQRLTRSIESVEIQARDHQAPGRR